jgi:hypothetical protein
LELALEVPLQVPIRGCRMLNKALLDPFLSRVR